MKKRDPQVNLIGNLASTTKKLLTNSVPPPLTPSFELRINTAEKEEVKIVMKKSSTNFSRSMISGRHRGLGVIDQIRKQKVTFEASLTGKFYHCANKVNTR